MKWEYWSPLCEIYFVSGDEEEGQEFTDSNKEWLKPVKKGALPMDEDSDDDVVSIHWYVFSWLLVYLHGCILNGRLPVKDMVRFFMICLLKPDDDFGEEDEEEDEDADMSGSDEDSDDDEEDGEEGSDDEDVRKLLLNGNFSSYKYEMCK